MKLKIDSFWLKIMALIFMIIDHIGYHFVTNIDLYILMRFLGRLAFPIFCFTFVEGFKYTSNKIKYGIRLLIAAIIMSIGNTIVGLEIFSPNIFATFFVMFLVLCLIERIIKEKKTLNKVIESVFAMILITCVILFLEYSCFAVFTIFCFYFIQNKYLRTAIYMVGSFVLCLLEVNIIQTGMILAIIPLWFYTSEKPKYKAKWLFYVFYPIHIWLFAILELFMV